MEETNRIKLNMAAYRRVNIEHQIQENLLKQTHLLNLRLYQSREVLFRRQKKIFEYQQRSSQLKQIANEINRKNYRIYLDEQIRVEQQKQTETNRQKSLLLKQFGELKHTINDPHSTLSTLAALSRSLLSLETQIK